MSQENATGIETGLKIANFVSECESVINQIDPELDYRSADLDGFVRGCWPTEDNPADVACEFANQIRSQQSE